MKTSKKILLSFGIYLLLLVAASFALLGPFEASQTERDARKAAAGSVDCAVFGASHALRGLDPAVLGQTLDCSCYNYSNVLMSLNAVRYIAEKEMDRNPIETVLIDLTFDTLSRDYSQETIEGEVATVRCLDSLPEKFLYLLRYVKPDQMLQIYGRELIGSFNFYKGLLLGDGEPKTVSKRGFLPLDANDVTIPEEQRAAVKDSWTIVVPAREDNTAVMKELIAFCKSRGARVILVTIPVSDAFLWEESGMDAFRETALELAAQTQCEYYDFNLLKNRGKLFSDDTSFFDITHMSTEGAAVFSEYFARIIRRVDQGEDVSPLFFTSYEEAARFSPYA